MRGWQKFWNVTRWRARNTITKAMAAGKWETKSFYVIGDAGCRVLAPHYGPVVQRTGKKGTRGK